MIKTINAIMLCTSLAGLVGVYGLKYSVADLASEKVGLERQIGKQEERLSLLKADWAYLNQPAHVGPIVARHQVALNLQPIAQQQFGDFNLPMRPAAPDAGALGDLLQMLDDGIDPIEQLIEAN